MSEVNVEELSIPLHHHVTRVSISDAHHVGCHQVARAGADVVFLGNCNGLFVVVGLQKEKGGPFIEGLDDALAEVLVYFGVVFGVNEFDEADLVACGEGAIDVHFEV